MRFVLGPTDCKEVIIHKFCHELIWSNLSIDFLSFLFMQFVTITQPLFNTLQSHVNPMLIILFYSLFLFIRKLRVLDVIFHTFNSHLLELIKILTLNLTGNELLCNLGIKITFKVGSAYVFVTFPFEEGINSL